jgi:uncharacterized protein (DUF1778 family)
MALLRRTIPVRDYTLRVRVETPLVYLINDAAEREGVTTSEFVRAAAKAAAQRALAKPLPPDPSRRARSA